MKRAHAFCYRCSTPKSRARTMMTRVGPSSSDSVSRTPRATGKCGAYTQRISNEARRVYYEQIYLMGWPCTNNLFDVTAYGTTPPTSFYVNGDAACARLAFCHDTNLVTRSMQEVRIVIYLPLLCTHSCPLSERYLLAGK